MIKEISIVAKNSCAPSPRFKFVRNVQKKKKKNRKNPDVTLTRRDYSEDPEDPPKSKRKKNVRERIRVCMRIVDHFPPQRGLHNATWIQQ